MPEEKIAIIGGASPYVPGILYSFARSEVLSGSEIVLMDVDPSRLPTMAGLGQRMVAEVGANLALTSTTDLTQALEGATFVLTNFRPGGLEGLRLDEEIPAKYDILGQETTGPGGTFFALRSIPQVLDLCRRMEDVCPEAYHHSWLIELRIGDEDGYPLLLERLRQPKRKGRSFSQKVHDFGIWMLERYGVWPANLGYLYPYFHHDDALADYRAGHSIYHMFMADLPEHWPNFEAMSRGEIPIHMDLSKHHTDVGHGDLAVRVIAAIAGDETQEFHVNVPNEGAITNLPAGAIVEVPALVDAGGVTPLCMGQLPKGVLGLTQSLIAWEELTVDAALSGDRDLVLQAVLAHPWVRSAAQAEAVCDEMFDAHAAYLPQFFGQ